MQSKFGEALFLEDVHSDFQDGQGKVEDADHPICDPHCHFSHRRQFSGEDDSQSEGCEDHEDSDDDSVGSQREVIEEELLVVEVMVAEVLSEFDEVGAVWVGKFVQAM